MTVLEWIVLFGAAVGAIAYLANVFFKLFKTWFKFIEDWNGTEENPGIVDRLKIGDARFEKIEHELGVIKSELFSNGGSSMRDAINRIENNINKPKRPTKKPKA
jgi:hypothetical protein